MLRPAWIKPAAHPQHVDHIVLQHASRHLLTIQSNNYELRPTGSCATTITSLSECAQAAKALGLTDQTVQDDRQSHKGYDPPGCYFEFRRLKINLDGTNTGKCSKYDQCLCKFTAMPTAFPTFGPTHVLDFNSTTPTVSPTTHPPTRPPTKTPTTRRPTRFPTRVPTLFPSALVQPAELAVLLKRCNSMIGTETFNETRVHQADIGGKSVQIHNHMSSTLLL